MYVFFHNYARSNVGSSDSLHLEKILTLHNGLILIKLVFRKNQNNY